MGSEVIRPRPQIVCICGSSKFCAIAAVKAWEFECQGILALSMHLLPSWYCPVQDHFAEHQNVAPILDELHLRKIDMADFIYVVNVEGYIGERTAIEIGYAKQLGKQIQYLEALEET
jgi:hypothetical protein